MWRLSGQKDLDRRNAREVDTVQIGSGGGTFHVGDAARGQRLEPCELAGPRHEALRGRLVPGSQPGHRTCSLVTSTGTPAPAARVAVEATGLSVVGEGASLAVACALVEGGLHTRVMRCVPCVK